MRGIEQQIAIATAVICVVACSRGTQGPAAAQEQAAAAPTAAAKTAPAKPNARVKKTTTTPADPKTPAGSRGDLSAPPDVAASPADAQKTPSGLASRVLAKGTGSRHPRASTQVEVHYTGWTTDGKMFDSSVKRGRTATFALNRVISGWTEGLQLMVEGEKRRFWIPQGLAYKGRPGKPAGMLVFDVELVKIKDIPPPEDVASPPADARKTASGLASRVLAQGTGSVHPTATSRVRVHYTGWTTDGGMFDSSVLRGRPATFPLNGVIKGWTEGLQLMVQGERRRFWIPVELAYDNRPGKPAGTLVFDVELLELLP